MRGAHLCHHSNTVTRHHSRTSWRRRSELAQARKIRISIFLHCLRLSRFTPHRCPRRPLGL